MEVYKVEIMCVVWVLRTTMGHCLEGEVLTNLMLDN